MIKYIALPDIGILNYPNGINDSDQIVGWYYDTSVLLNRLHTYIYHDGAYQSLSDDPHGEEGTYFTAINDKGLMAGTYGDNATKVYHGFIYNDGSFTTLTDPLAATQESFQGGNYSISGTQAYGINDKGQVVGQFAESNNVPQGFLYRHGKYTTIDDPHAGAGFGQGTTAHAINDFGEIVGWYIDKKGVTHGFLYSINTHDFTTLNDPSAGKGSTYAEGINDLGEIVGLYVDKTGVDHGFLYSISTGQFTTINDPLAGTGKFEGTELIGINNHGQILGIYFDSSGHQHGFYT